MRRYAALYNSGQDESFVISQDVEDGIKWSVFTMVESFSDAKQIAEAMNKAES